MTYEESVLSAVSQFLGKSELKANKVDQRPYLKTQIYSRRASSSIQTQENKSDGRS